MEINLYIKLNLHTNFNPYVIIKDQGKKIQIVVKSMFYLPIIPRLQRMFASMQTTPHMTWHHKNQSQGKLRHPLDGEA